MLTPYSIDSVLSLDDADREKVILQLTERERLELLYAWRIWARAEQLPPTEAWDIWFIMAGRGFGKTRTGAETVRDEVESGRSKRLAGIAATAADARDTMVEGESGILAVSRPDFYPKYEPSKRRVTWPNGARMTLFSAEQPGRLRGPQHDFVWCDELAEWQYLTESWSNMQFGLRLGQNPRIVVTTTPRPLKLIRDLIAASKVPGSGVIVTGGSTYANLDNLSPSFRRLIAQYEGTSLGRQELHAELLSEVPGALWKRTTIDKHRVRLSECPPFVRVAVGVDPAVTSGEDADSTGIVVAALGTDMHVYILDDLTIRDAPIVWATTAVSAYNDYQADVITAEVNNGGDLVAFTIATVDVNVPVHSVHASRGKRTRAEPISSLYEQGRVHHVINPAYEGLENHLEELEDQLCTWISTSPESPDRLDALVWAVTELVMEPMESGQMFELEDAKWQIGPPV